MTYTGIVTYLCLLDALPIDHRRVFVVFRQEHNEKCTRKEAGTAVQANTKTACCVNDCIRQTPVRNPPYDLFA